ncbi:protein TonB [Marivirga lumbricoides]|uniref:Protein TonB n=3 Tax=Marivirga lumbricoides TaxID=1046115 RepID=A0ABQ1MC06_9BACT|nr:protein TonB [Marivirga lumbricoides]
MELKKNPHVDVYRLKSIFFNIGLVISISSVFAIFQFKVYDNTNVVDLGVMDDRLEEVMDIPLTTQPPPPPPKIQLPEIVEVANEELIIEDIDLELDLEMTENTTIEPSVYQEPLLDEPEEEKADEIFSVVEVQAEPVGGVGAFYEYVASQLKDNYPHQAEEMNIQGIVYVQFVVEKDGSITDVQAVKGIGGGCDELAIKVVRNSPKWNPGRQRGKAVRSRKVVPIRFKLVMR